MTRCIVSLGGALRDIPKNGCEGDYSHSDYKMFLKLCCSPLLCSSDLCVIAEMVTLVLGEFVAIIFPRSTIFSATWKDQQKWSICLDRILHCNGSECLWQALDLLSIGLLLFFIFQRSSCFYLNQSKFF